METKGKNPSFIQSLVQLSGAGLFGQIVEVLNNFLRAYLLGPTLLGIIKFTNLVEVYAGYNDFGAIFGMNLELPIARGRGENKLAEDLKNTTLTLLILFTSLTLIILGIAYKIGWNWGGQLTAEIWWFIHLLLITNRLDAFLFFIVRAENRFDIASKKRTFEGILALLIGVPALYFWRITGVFLSLIVIRILSSILTWYWIDFKYRIFFSWNAAKRLFKVGILSFLTNLENKLLRGLELIIITSMMTSYELGLFGFALSFLVMLDVIPDSARQILFRRMAFDKGKFNSNESENKTYQLKYFEKPFILYLLITALLGGVGFLGFAFLIPRFLTQYNETVHLLFVLVVGEVFYKIRVFSAISLTANKRLIMLLLIQGSALLFNIIVDIILVKNGYGILGAALGSSISYFMFSIVFLIFSNYYLDKSIKDVISIFLMVFIASFISFAWLWLMENILFQSHYIRSFYTETILTLFKMIIYIFVCSASFFIIFRRYKLLHESLIQIQKIVQKINGNKFVLRFAYRNR